MDPGGAPQRKGPGRSQKTRLTSACVSSGVGERQFREELLYERDRIRLLLDRELRIDDARGVVVVRVQ